MKLYTKKAIDNLIEKYDEKHGDMISQEGSLLTEYLLFWKGLKFAVVLEQYLNEWSSAYTVKMYKKLPKKYDEYFWYSEQGRLY